MLIDKASPVPLYYQLAQQLEAQIRSGRLHSGDRLENEIALANQLGVSRPTVRSAIQFLVDGGLVSRQRGVGTLVLPPAVRRREAFTSLYDELEKSGRRPRTEVLAFRIGPATVEIARRLDLAPGDEVYVVERLRYASDEPLALMHNWLPVDGLELTEDDLTAGGLYAALRRDNVAPKVATQLVGARGATPAEAKVLHERRGAPLLTMERTAWDQRGRAIEYGAHLYRASRYSLEITLGAS
ncbi:MAG: GntR family transcriptional regulator [Acidimicrobiales bacterium]